jgi:hypothetical protein
MAGKSTYIRQVALLTLLAHTGSFIPAKEARIDLVDRIFTRIGASDDLARGQSTFMVEMSETANILNNATPRSLIILDEIGRGTSTFDGLSLAWSIVEYLHNIVGAKTLFATHYHELTELAQRLPRIKNYNVAVREWHDAIVFLRKIVEGGTDKSYGIQVARLAGVPKEVLERAKQILQSPGIVGGEDQRHPVPANIDVWMVPGFLRDPSDGVDEADGAREVLEFTGAPDRTGTAGPFRDRPQTFSDLRRGQRLHRRNEPGFDRSASAKRIPGVERKRTPGALVDAPLRRAGWPDPGTSPVVVVPESIPVEAVQAAEVATSGFAQVRGTN